MTWQLRRLDADDSTSAGFHLWTPSAAAWGESKPLVLLGQPYNINPEWAFLQTAIELTKRGFVVVATELRGGHGRPDSSRDLFSFKDNLDDYIAIARACGDLDGVDRSRVVLHGYSYATVLAALAAPIVEPALLVLQAPVLYPDEHFHGPRSLFNEYSDDRALRLSSFMRRRHFDDDWKSIREPLAAVAAYTELPVSRVSVITHGLDEFMPVGISGSYAEAAAPKKVSRKTFRRLFHAPQGQTCLYAKPLATLIERELALALPAPYQLPSMTAPTTATAMSIARFQ